MRIDTLEYDFNNYKYLGMKITKDGQMLTISSKQKENYLIIH